MNRKAICNKAPQALILFIELHVLGILRGCYMLVALI